MSYILDALKRADADRERQLAGVPDLHAQTDALSYRELAAVPPSRWWVGGLVVAALAAAGWAWWMFSGRSEPAMPVAMAPSAVVVTPAPAPAPSQALAPSTAPAPAPATIAAPPPAPPPAPAPSPALRAVTPRPAPQQPTPVAKPPAAERLTLYATLPPTLRGQIPALSVNGSVYSPKRSSRIVILNGQVFREGDRPTDGLVVEEIRLKSSVLSFRGTRFELPH